MIEKSLLKQVIFKSIKPGSDNIHIWTNKFENIDQCTLHKTRYFDDIFTFIENEYYLMPRKIGCIEINDQINDYLKQLDDIDQESIEA